MPQATANGLQFEYETFGEPDRPAILLIMGLGGQLILWPDAFCLALARAGYHVIRYDNRDVGLSSRLDHLGQPRLLRIGLAYKLGLRVSAPYRLEDMAADAAALLDALGIASAHVVGASMGGMIAQILAARRPHRVRSLVLMSTGGGGARAPGPSLRLGLRLLRRPGGGDRQTHIANHLRLWRMVGSPSYPTPEAEMRAHAERSYERAHHPRGLARQAAALMASAARAPFLTRLPAPTLILHGREDRVMPVACAYDLAARLRGAQLEVLPGMGHDLPAALLPHLSRAVIRHVGAVERRPAIAAAGAQVA